LDAERRGAERKQDGALRRGGMTVNFGHDKNVNDKSEIKSWNAVGYLSVEMRRKNGEENGS
jgi:hypothetical protein